MYPVKPIQTGEFRKGTISRDLAKMRALEEAQSHPKPEPILEDTRQRKASLNKETGRSAEGAVSQFEGVAQASSKVKEHPEKVMKKSRPGVTSQAGLDKTTTEDTGYSVEGSTREDNVETKPGKKKAKAKEEKKISEDLITMNLDWMSSDTEAVKDRKWLDCLSWEGNLGLVEHEDNYYFRHQIWVMANKRRLDMALERVLWEDRQQRLQRYKDTPQSNSKSAEERTSEARTSDAEQAQVHTEPEEQTENVTSEKETELKSEEKTPEILRLIKQVLDPENVNKFIHDLPEMFLDGTLEGIDKFMSLKEALTILRPKLPEPKPRLTTLNPDSDWTVLYGSIPSNRSVSKKLKQIGGDYGKYFDWDIAEAQKYQELPISLYANLALRKNPHFDPRSRDIATHGIWQFAQRQESLLHSDNEITTEKDVQEA